MGARSAVTALPEDVRSKLDRELIARQFSGYSDLETWLTEQGFQVSRSSLHRYGSAFERRLNTVKIATEQARAIVAASPDEEGAMGEALVRMTQNALFDVLIEINDEDNSIDNLPKIAQAVARLTESSVKQKRYAFEVKSRAQAVAESVSAQVQKAGLSPETVDKIRAQILGVAG